MTVHGLNSAFFSDFQKKEWTQFFTTLLPIQLLSLQFKFLYKYLDEKKNVLNLLYFIQFKIH